MSQANVFQARYKYEPHSLGSMSSTCYMLIRQYNFPNTYDPDFDLMLDADSDRLVEQDGDRINQCFKEHNVGSIVSIESWVKSAEDKSILNFLCDLFQVEKKEKWTGYRILGGVHQRNGWPVWSLSLFAKHPNTNTQVYTGEDAPNVAQIYPSSAKRVA